MSTLVKLLATVVLGVPLLASAQIVPAQNQLIVPPYGGWVVATSSSGISKLSASSTPYFATLFFGNATGTTLFVGGLQVDAQTGCATFAGGFLTGTGSACSSAATFGTTSISALFPIKWNTTLAQLSWLGLSTSTNPTIGHLPYWTGVNTLGDVATGTITCTGTTSCGAGSFVVGNNLTITGTQSPVSSIGTTSPITIGQGAYFSSVTPTILSPFSTSTLAGTGVVQITNSPAIIGGSAAVASLVGGTAGQILGWVGGAPTWTATTTFTGTAPISTTFLNGQVTIACTSCNVDGTSWKILNGALTPTTTLGIIVNASSSIASLSVGNSTTTNATTTSLEVGALASTTNLIVSSAGGSGTRCAQFGAFGLISAGTTCGVATSSLFTGTTGQVAYFNGTNSLTGTSSIFISTAQNVGIGTLVPAANLHVAGGTTGSGMTEVLRLVNAGANAGDGATIDFRWNGTAGSLLGGRIGLYPTAVNTGDLLFYTANGSAPVERMRITSTGNVGIGTTNPTDVNANARLTVSGTGFQDIIASTTDNTTSSASIFETYAAGSRVFFGSHGANQVSTRYGLTLGGWGELTATTSTSGSLSGLIVGTQGNVPLVFGTNNVERMRITGAGNVGIGTTTPGSSLTIQAGGTASVATIGQLSGVTSFSGIAFTADVAPAVTTANYSLLGNGTNTFLNRPTGGDILFRENNVNQMVLKTSTGNLGIGTTSPSAKLVVAATTLPNINLDFTDNTSVGQLLINQSSANKAFFDYIGTSYVTASLANTARAGGFSGVPFALYANNAEAVRITTAGNVGIGTTSPQSIFEVEGTPIILGAGELGQPTDTTIRGAAGRGTNIAGGNLTFDASDGTGISGGGALIWRTASPQGSGSSVGVYSEVLRMTNTQKVGIATTTPQNKLSVGASASIGKDYMFNAPTDGLIVEGNTGIGTAAPLSRLDVSGGVAIGSYAGSKVAPSNGLLVSGVVGIGTSTPNAGRSLTLSSAFQPAFAFDDQGGVAGTKGFGFIYDGGTVLTGGGLVLQALTDTSAFSANLSTLFRDGSINFGGIVHPGTNGQVVVTSGNVGVATTSPWRTLAVTGTVGFDGLTGSAGLQVGILCLSANKEVINESVACVASSEKYKQNIRDLPVGLDEVMKFRPVSFTWKTDFNGDLKNDQNKTGIQYSLIAEEVHAVDPNLTYVTTSTSTFEGVEYPAGTVEGIQESNHWVALFVKAFQDVERQIQSVMARLDGDEAKIKDLQAQINLINTKLSK